MKEGHLSQYFEAVVAKKLSAVEANPKKSNQHEFNVTKAMLDFLGREEKKIFHGKFLYFCDDSDHPIVGKADLTFYDARANHETRTEYRLYFQNSEVSEAAREGDLLIIAKCKDGGLVILISEGGSTKENQLRWLFGIADLDKKGFQVYSNERNIDYSAKIILEQIGIEIIEDSSDFLNQMLEQFANDFPTTNRFSAFARNSIKGLSPVKDPDKALMVWMEQEENLFKTLEKHFLTKELTKLRSRKQVDPDEYMQLMMSFQQRRKSRAGSALENHLEQLFHDHSIKYDRTKITEGKKKPDFIFPSIKEYHDPKTIDSKLTMLAAKTTCKDRWRQILNEADKIKIKHLVTLEPSISKNQTDEMKIENVQLVLPKDIHQTYSKTQQGWLMSISEFINFLKEKQES